MADDRPYYRTVAERINANRGFVVLTSLDGKRQVSLPYPAKESGLQTVATVVNSARGANGVVRGEKLGRDQGKVEMTWPVLTPEIWSELLQFFNANFYFKMRYLDMVTNTMVTRECYVGDRSAQPFLYDKTTNRPKYYLNCKANVVDTGR